MKKIEDGGKMYLKKIIAQGFKSFADNIVIDLEQNIAGIVGPNGSGKSNVVDAIRWVLGEQSVKSLRGDGNMTDVIFAGSKSRSSMGTATVTLIFDNHDNYLPLSFEEIAIKRRLYKDGTNEFFINNEKVRLKDVSDLLMDSGIGKESFNIIGQGKIDEILSNKPVDRRSMFEEAAGVLKYKKRKEEALRKLERTHDNMKRVEDIIKELEIQVEPLREQKQKALEYFDLSDTLKNLEVALVTEDITTLNEKYQDNKERVNALTLELASISTHNSKFEAQIVEYKQKELEIVNKVNSLQKSLLECTTKAEKINSQKEILLERKKYEVDDAKLHNTVLELKEAELKYENELKSYEMEIENILKELESYRSKKEELETIISTKKIDRQKLEERLTSFIRNQKILDTKISSLEDSIENGSSLPYAVKSVLNHPKLNGIHNTIGNLVTVEERFIMAISTALGGASNYVVVNDELCAKEAINYLKNNKLGRATFFPLNVIEGKALDSRIYDIVKKEKGFIEVASNLVQNDSKYDKIITNQLGTILVMDTLDNANILNKKLGYKYRMVTLDGELLHVGGSLTGGESKQKNILSEKQELETLIKEKETQTKTIKSLEEGLNACDYDLKAKEDEYYLVSRDNIRLEEEVREKNKKIEQLREKIVETKNTLSGTNSVINNSLSEEEDNILKEYYEALNEKERIANELSYYQNEKTKISDELAEFEHFVKKDNALYLEKTKEMKELEIEVNRSDVKLDNLLNLLSETYSMTYEHAKENFILPIPTNEARTQVSSLKRKIRELGPINQQAPEEYDRVSERYEFLISQQEDLIKAENTLLDIIKEMDRVMETNFAKTFEIINKHFAETFKELFKGGTASLKLTDPTNLLETGIEIVASPPGKSLKSISLLSGGEKTFTAISLLFAILKTRPMPFCILDEVEAALDEVNVESFGEYLQSLKKKTQFIVITHKKKTMEFADTLYGITMQESGVSKLVSVKLEEIEK